MSYRTDDAAYVAAGIHSGLVRMFGEHRVFRDCNSMPPGTRYPAAIRRALAGCSALVAIVGPKWLDAADDAGGRRIDSRRDWVRRELAEAIRGGIPIFPVLLDGAQWPAAGKLPADIREFAYLQFAKVSHRTLTDDLARLVDSIAARVPGLSDGRLDPESPRGVAENARNVQTNNAPDGAIYATQGGNMTVHVQNPEDRR